MSKNEKLVLFVSSDIFSRESDYRTDPHTLYKQVIPLKTSKPKRLKGWMAADYLRDLPSGINIDFETVGSNVQRSIIFLLGRSRFLGQNLCVGSDGTSDHLLHPGNNLVVVCCHSDENIESLEFDIYTVTEEFELWAAFGAPGGGPRFL